MASHEPHNTQEVIRQLQAGGNVPAELLEIFNEEAEEHLRIIYDGLDQLKKSSVNLEAIANVRRSAHTLKGAAGAVGLESATRLAHRMEDMLDQLAKQKQGPNADQLKLLLTAADLLQDLTAGDVDVESTAIRLAEVYNGLSQQLGSLNSISSESGSKPKPLKPLKSAGPNLDLNRDRRKKRRPSQEERYLRVPLRRLDDLVGTVGEMIVNRSAMNQRLGALETRINDIFNTLQRTRSTSFELQNNYNLESAAAMTAGVAQQANPETGKFDALEFDRYTDFHLLAQVLAEGSSDVEIVTSELRTLKTDLENLLRRQDQLNRDAQNSLMHIRMVPLSSIISKLQRTVRTVSGKLNKKIELIVSGDRTEMDKTVMDEIVDPLQHLLRNAMDHGVESAEDRKAAGKPAESQLLLEAIYQGTQVTIRISDDGRGIDVQRVRAKALENGLIDDNDELTAEEIYRLIFLPGFSTASKLTDVSGRGVGMDVVRDAIVRLNGTIRVHSEPGQGTTFTIQLPTTVGVTQAVMVETVNRTFAIPMQSVGKIMRLDLESIGQNDERLMVEVDDRWLELRDLANHLGLPSSNHVVPDVAPPLLILQVGDNEIALGVDSIVGGQDVVVKSLGDHLRHVPGLIGATVQSDGSIAPILDPVNLVSRGSTVSSSRHTESDDPAPTSKVRVSTAMVIDDSISVRRVTSNLLQTAGWDVVTARDGVDALEKLDAMETPPDVFLCDMEMPRMDGIELVKRLRKQPEFAETPIVMVTSRASEKHRSMAYDAGASDYVIKPYNDEQLLELINELVQIAWETVEG